MHPTCKGDEPEVAVTMNKFWDEFDQFETKSGVFANRKYIYKSEDLVPGRTHRWHKINLLPFTQVLGRIGCRVCSKIAGIGNAERSWGDVKKIKSGMKSHYNADKTKRKATIYAAGRTELARLEQNNEPLKFWDDSDIQGHFDVLRGDNSNDDEQPERIFKAWHEEWETTSRFINDPVEEAKLLAKYGGLEFYDPDTETMRTICSTQLEWT